jgi:hypothetical protein
MNQVARDKQLLETARDCFHFVTKFFEPINVSAAHIYHSALELSPLSSVVRRLYYHQRHTPFPRVLVGTPDIWDHDLAHPYLLFNCSSYSWSPCGQFIAGQTQKAVEIHDILTFELLSTLQPTEPSSQLVGMLAYSPDGHSLASLSNTSLIIWDIQTGGVTKEIPYHKAPEGSLVWSLDGRTVGTLALDQNQNWVVHIYDITSGARMSSDQFGSCSQPHLWAHDTSFRAMTMDGQACTINILGVGSVFTKVESFHVTWRIRNAWTKLFMGEEPSTYSVCSFSPITYHISIQTYSRLLILDVRNSGCLLKQRGHFDSHCFSSNGSHFAAYSKDSVHIWKCTSPHYTSWREFQVQGWNSFALGFSPTSQSLIAHEYGRALQVWPLDSPPITVHPRSHSPLVTPSPCGTYTVASHWGDSTITITSLLSQTSHSIKTGMKIEIFALTGNVLLVKDSRTIAAWRLTGGGAVEGVSGNGRADHHNRIWTIPYHYSNMFVVENQTVTIQDRDSKCIHIYNPGTGEILKPTNSPSSNFCYTGTLHDIYNCYHYPHSYTLGTCNTCPIDNWPVSQTMFREGWAKDPQGKYRLWIPAKWRKPEVDGAWFCDSTTLNLSSNIIIKF